MRPLRILRHWLIPHESNNHRAKAIHADALLAYALILLVFNFGIRLLHRRAPDVLGYATDIRVERLLEATNSKRVAAGLSPLTLNSTLSAAAAAKASDMFVNNYWTHTSPNGKTPWDFIVAAGYRYTLAGENLAKNFSTSEQVVDAWMASQTHKDNILKAGYRDIGFAVVNGALNGEETTLVVQMFGVTQAPRITQVQAVAPSPTVAPPAAPFIEQTAFAAVKTTPRINIPTLTREVTMAFVGLLVGVLLVDAYVVSRRKVVRLAGHNLGHILFLGSIFVGSLFVTRGSLL